MRVILDFLKYSSLHVALLSGIHMLAFLLLPLGTSVIHWPTLTQIFITTWIIYIVDRLLDNINNQGKSKRHQYFHKYQYNFSLLTIALIIIDLAICFFQKTEILLFGFLLTLVVTGYLITINKIKRFAKYKEYFMPLVFVSAVTVPPFIFSSSINLSSWILAIMYMIIIYQNIFLFSYFEYINDENSDNLLSKIGEVKLRRWINFLGAINIIIFAVLFLNFSTYPDKMAAIITTISFLYTMSIVFQEKIRYNYRGILDGLLFLFALIFFI